MAKVFLKKDRAIKFIYFKSCRIKQYHYRDRIFNIVMQKNQQ